MTYSGVCFVTSLPNDLILRMKKYSFRITQFAVHVYLTPKFHAELAGKALKLAEIMQSHSIDILLLYLKSGGRG